MVSKHDSYKYEQGRTESKRTALGKSVLYLLQTRGEMKPRDISGQLGTNLTDVNEVLRELRDARLVEREQINIGRPNARFVYRAAAAREPVRPADFQNPEARHPTKSTIGVTKGNNAKDFLWSDGRRVARVTRSISEAAQEYGRKGYGEIKIEGPSYTAEQRNQARKQGMALPHTQYMRVAVKVVDPKVEYKQWYCELINPKNLNEYLLWFPTLALNASDARH